MSFLSGMHEGVGLLEILGQKAVVLGEIDATSTVFAVSNEPRNEFVDCYNNNECNEYPNEGETPIESHFDKLRENAVQHLGDLSV